nr:hypothetical protein [Lachnospiraceae bacterium]
MPPKEKNAVRRVNTSPINANRDALLENGPQLNTAVHMPDRLSLNANRDKEQFKSPIMLHPVSANLDEVQLLPPDPRRIENAYRDAGFEYAGSDRKKRGLLRESIERYNLQERLSMQMQDEEMLIVKTDISVKKAMEKNDAELVRNYDSYEGDGMPYVNVRYRLIRNRYYAVLPVKEMRKLERKDLLSRLRAEYKKSPRNPDLIEFYEDLIRLKGFEDAQNEKKKHRDNPENPPAAIGAQELRHNQTGYNRNRDRIRGLHISNEEKTARIEAMGRVMRPAQGRHFWQD